MKQTTKGLKPNKRKLATTSKGKLTANQWQNTPQQNMFMQLWLDPNSPSFANAYKSAVAAGYKDWYAQQLASPSVNNKWITEYTKKLTMTDEHVLQALQALAMNAHNSRSPDDTRVKALELISRIKGMIDNKGTTVNIVTPILGGESVKKSSTVIDS